MTTFATSRCHYLRCAVASTRRCDLGECRQHRLTAAATDRHAQHPRIDIGGAVGRCGSGHQSFTMIPNQDISTRLLAWFDQYGLRDLPWQHPRTPYRVWLSEIMLQQTQVSAWLPLISSASSMPCPTCPHWSMLRRTRCWHCGRGWATTHVHATCTRRQNCAWNITTVDRRTSLPHSSHYPALAAAPPVRSLSQAWNTPAPILDGNVKRVLCRVFGIEGWLRVHRPSKNSCGRWLNHCCRMRDRPIGRKRKWISVPPVHPPQSRLPAVPTANAVRCMARWPQQRIAHAQTRQNPATA